MASRLFGRFRSILSHCCIKLIVAYLLNAVSVDKLGIGGGLASLVVVSRMSAVSPQEPAAAVSLDWRERI